MCWHNAQQEPLLSTLKTEYYQRHRFETRAEAIKVVSSWMETVNYHGRRHSARAQFSPGAFARNLTTAAAKAALPMSPERGQPRFNVAGVGGPVRRQKRLDE